MKEAKRLNAVRDRLVDALKVETSMPGLRTRLVELAADIEAWREGRLPSSSAFAAVRDTVPCPPPTTEGPNTEPDSAPSVDVDVDGAGP